MRRRWSSSWWPCPHRPPRSAGRDTGRAGVHRPDSGGHGAARRIVPGADHQFRPTTRSSCGRARQDRCRLRRSFAAGQTVRLTEADLALRGGTGTLRLGIQPANAQVTVARAGGSVLPASTGGALELDEAPTPSSPARRLHGAQRTRAGSRGTNCFRELRAGAGKAQADGDGPGHGGLGCHRLDRRRQAFVRRGGGSVLYKSSGSPGVYSFTVTLAAGGGVFRGKSLEWVMDYHDDRNYVLFHLDKNDFRRIQLINGKRTELVKKPHGLSMVDSLSATVQVEVAARGSHRQPGSQRRPVGGAGFPGRRPSANFIQAASASSLTARMRCNLSNFSFTPKE